MLGSSKKGVITKEQGGVLDDLSKMILELESASELAFGNNTEVTLNVITGKLTMEEYDPEY